MNKGIILLIVFALGVAAVAAILYEKAGKHAPPAAVAPSAPAPAHSDAALARGSAAPLFELADLNGKVWRLAELKGKVVFLNFWATWCESCRHENPTLQALMQAEKGNDKFVLITVLTNDEPAKARAYLKENKLSFPVLIGTGEVAAAYGLTGVPETFILDKKGLLREKAIGPMNWNTPDMRTFIAQLAAE